MAIDLEKSNREEIITYLKRKGETGLTQKRKDDLLRMAKRVMKKENNKKHSGGAAPVAANAAIPKPYNFGDAWEQAAPVALDAGSVQMQDGGKRRRSRRQRGGEETEGATPNAPQFYDPSAPLPQPNSDMNSAYGPINAVSGACRNLAPFPGATDQQTGGKKRPSKSKKETKPKKAHPKKEESLWDKLMGMF